MTDAWTMALMALHWPKIIRTIIVRTKLLAVVDIKFKLFFDIVMQTIQIHTATVAVVATVAATVAAAAATLPH